MKKTYYKKRKENSLKSVQKSEKHIPEKKPHLIYSFTYNYPFLSAPRNERNEDLQTSKYSSNEGSP